MDKTNKVLAINGSPHKNATTTTLLQKALDGATSTGVETVMIHLVDLRYQGCISCFACKRKGTKFIGSCALRDDLTPVLEKAMQSDTIILCSPIYLADVTSLIRAFIERFGLHKLVIHYVDVYDVRRFPVVLPGVYPTVNKLSKWKIKRSADFADYAAKPVLKSA